MLMTMMMTAQLAQAMQGIKLECLDDGPGLLPFKLGQTRLISHYHTFIQYIQLDDIQTKIDMIKLQINDFEHRLPNDTYVLYELQINYLSEKLNDVTEHLRSLEPSRAKRGLINGLGSIVKSISGNLDYSDAVQYDNLIKELKTTQNKIFMELNSHISLSKDWMTQHYDVMSQLVKNQEKLNSTLELLLDKDAYGDSNLIKYAKFAQLLTIISENTYDLYKELQRIENI